MTAPKVVITPRIVASVKNPNNEIGNSEHDFAWPPQDPLYQFLAGVAAGQLDTWFDDVRTLASGANETLDLSGTSLKDAFGTSIALAHVNVLALYAAPGNTTDLTFGNDANPFLGPLGAAAHTVSLKPGGLAFFVHPGAGWAVTASTADGIKAVNGSGAAATYTIFIGGRTV